MARNPEILHLLSLLDDEDESIAVDAMAELLLREDELGDALAELQESPNPLFRRRGHQLQAAITLRRRRREFIRKLRAPRVDLIDSLIDVHLQWYDNDSRPELETLWNKFRLDAARCPLHTLEEVAYFMRKSGFAAQQETTLRPENYCIGPILENHTGSGWFRRTTGSSAPRRESDCASSGIRACCCATRRPPSSPARSTVTVSAMC